MTENGPEEESRSQNGGVVNAGTGVAFGAALGTIVFVFTDDPVWIALGAGIGVAFGAAFRAMKDR